MRVSIAAFSFALTLAALTLASPASAIIANVDSADDLCSPTADPCVISEVAELVPGALLDFGLRQVSIIGGGQLDAGPASFTLRCGRFTANVSGQAIKLRGPTGELTSAGGTGLLEIRKSCSGNTAQPCLSDTICSSQGAGTCSVGSGNLELAGKVFGSADDAAAFLVRAAGSVQIDADVTVNGNSFEADGGAVEISSRGPIVVNAKIEASSGGDGGGGDICLVSDADITINTTIEATGGNFDGGLIELDAGGDILITDDVNADAGTGEGFGGSISMFAGGDISVIGGTGFNRLLLTTQGNTGVDGAASFGGDGGPQDYFAGGSIYFSEFVKLRADGAAPDGFGEVVTLDADEHIVVEGDIDTTARGSLGGGGEVALFAFGDVTIASTSAIRLTGGDGGGGDVSIAPLGDVTIAGLLDVSSSASGVAGFIDIDTNTALTISGDLVNDGGALPGASGSFDLKACSLDAAPGASIDNKADLGVNTITVRRQMTLASGAALKAQSGGSNTIHYRDAGLPPQLNGTVAPSAALILDPLLPACPLCGNGVLDGNETCDDGNRIPGDGCASDCVNEGCIAQTPGYPTVSLCSDGDGCTVDVCNPVTSTCEHSPSCDDGFACTLDTCAGSVCVHTPSDLLCDDSNVCTDEVCTVVSGCVFVPNVLDCDDGLFCNGEDACASGTCSLHTGSPCEGFPECQDVCDEVTRECVAPFFHPCAEDGNPCTADVCNGLGACTHLPSNNPCDDGIFCNGPDFCSGTICQIHAGDPCNGGADCFDVCSESAAACLSPAGSPCGDDGNVCTDDTCDGGGACLHEPNVAACDDGDFCTSTDQCSGGSCQAGDLSPMIAQFVFNRKVGINNDRALFKASMPFAAQSANPSDVGITVQLRDEAAAPLYDATMPALHVEDVGAKGKTFRFRDKDKLVAEANGIISAIFKRNPTKGEVRVKIRTRDYEMPQVIDRPEMSMSLLFGSDPGVDDCLTAASVACVTKGGRKVRCR